MRRDRSVARRLTEVVARASRIPLTYNRILETRESFPLEYAQRPAHRHLQCVRACVRSTVRAFRNAPLFDSNGRISFARLPAFRGERVIPVGSEMTRGSVIAHQSDCVNPWLAMQIARGGHSEIEVFRRPRVAFIPTGDELLPIDRKVPSGKNLESNSQIGRAHV